MTPTMLTVATPMETKGHLRLVTDATDTDTDAPLQPGLGCGEGLLDRFHASILNWSDAFSSFLTGR